MLCSILEKIKMSTVFLKKFEFGIYKSPKMRYSVTHKFDDKGVRKFPDSGAF